VDLPLPLRPTRAVRLRLGACVVRVCEGSVWCDCASVMRVRCVQRVECGTSGTVRREKECGMTCESVSHASAPPSPPNSPSRVQRHVDALERLDLGAVGVPGAKGGRCD
jgi:hypothetical protein